MAKESPAAQGCNFCDSSYPTRQLLSCHLHVEHNVPMASSAFGCPLCDAVGMADIASLDRHLADRHPEFERATATTSVPQETEPEDDPLVCRDCGKRMSNERALKTHVQLKHVRDGNCPCPFCPEEFTGLEGLRKHFTETHAKSSRQQGQTETPEAEETKVVTPLRKTSDARVSGSASKGPRTNVARSRNATIAHFGNATSEDPKVENSPCDNTQVKAIRGRKAKRGCSNATRAEESQGEDRNTIQDAKNARAQKAATNPSAQRSPKVTDSSKAEAEQDPTIIRVCPKCPQKFADEETLTGHLVETHVKASEGSKCPVCDKLYKRSGFLVNHIRKVHSNDRENAAKMPAAPPSKPYSPEARDIFKQSSGGAEPTKRSRAARKGIEASKEVEPTTAAKQTRIPEKVEAPVLLVPIPPPLSPKRAPQTAPSPSPVKKAEHRKQCPECGMNFRKVSLKENHMRETHGSKTKPSSNKDAKRPSQKISGEDKSSLPSRTEPSANEITPSISPPPIDTPVSSRRGKRKREDVESNPEKKTSEAVQEAVQAAQTEHRPVTQIPSQKISGEEKISLPSRTEPSANEIKPSTSPPPVGTPVSSRRGKRKREDVESNPEKKTFEGVQAGQTEHRPVKRGRKPRQKREAKVEKAEKTTEEVKKKNPEPEVAATASSEANPAHAISSDEEENSATRDSERTVDKDSARTAVTREKATSATSDIPAADPLPKRSDNGADLPPKPQILKETKPAEKPTADEGSEPSADPKIKSVVPTHCEEDGCEASFVSGPDYVNHFATAHLADPTSAPPRPYCAVCVKHVSVAKMDHLDQSHPEVPQRNLEDAELCRQYQQAAVRPSAARNRSTVLTKCLRCQFSLADQDNYVRHLQEKHKEARAAGGVVPVPGCGECADMLALNLNLHLRFAHPYKPRNAVEVGGPRGPR